MAHKARSIRLVASALLLFAIPPAFAQNDTKPTLTRQPDILSLFALNGDVEGVETMLDRGADVNGVDSNGNTALTQSLQNFHFALALELIDKGARSDLGDGREGCMTLAVIRGNIDVVKALLAHGAAADKSNYPTVENASAIGDFEIVKLLVAHGANVNRKDVLDGNAVLQAVNTGNVQLLRYLLGHGGNPNVREQDGQTPLTSTITRGHEEMIPILLQHGADIRQVNGEGYTALDLASDGWHPATVKILKAAWDKLPATQRKRLGLATTEGEPLRLATRLALMRACSDGDVEAARALIAHGVSPIAQPLDEDTPLYLAIRSGSLQLVRLLLDHGVSVDERQAMNDTPICHAAMWHSTSIARLLIERGAKVDPDNVSDPPLVEAAAKSNPELVELLLDHGADVDARDANGASALWYAADLDNPSITKMLLAHNATVEAPDLASGDTPLIRAARHGRRSIVSMLLSKGANASTANFGGDTAFDVASDGYHPKTLAVLHAGPGTGVAKADEAGYN